MSGKSRLAGPLLACCSLLITLISLEFTLRLLQPKFPTNLVPTLFTDTVGIVNWPGYQGCYNLEGFSCYSINNEGWRDENHQLQKPANTYRIAVIGDSFVEALQVQENQTFWKRLESDLVSQGKRVEVLAFGMSGFDVAQYYEALRDYADKYQPDLVIVAFYSGNDLRDSVRQINNIPWKPYYLLNANGHLVLDSSFKAYVRAQNTWRNQLYRTVRNSSVLLTLFDSAYKNAPGKIKQFRAWLEQSRTPPSPPPSAAASASASGDGLAKPGLSGAEIFSPPPSGSLYAQAWAITEQLFLAINQDVQAHHARLVILGVDNPDREYDRVVAAGLNPFYPEERMSAFAAQHNLRYLPLAPHMRQIYQQTGQYMHIAGEGHYSQLGHQEVAHLLENYLAAQKLIPE